MPDFLSDADIAANGIEVAEIQGNILAGFNKDHEALVFVRFGDIGEAKAWLGHLANRVATSAEVIAFNRLFKAVQGRRNDRDDTDTVQATWINVAVTNSGLVALGEADDGMDPSFIAGMANRAPDLGDDGEAAPGGWVVGRAPDEVHAVLIIASDRRDDLHRAIAHELQRLAGHGVSVVFVQEGHTRSDDPGHEHFGYKDGISQPGLRGVHQPNPADPEQGDLGSDLLELGEFVLGYQTQPGVAVAPPPTDGYPAPAPPTEGAPSTSGPGWTKNGSYYVFRRLRQDVPSFQEGITAAAAAIGVSDDAMGAIVVGRYKSGAPLEVTGRVATDPFAPTGDDINQFEYKASDADGHVVPHASHIRKTYPRDADTPGGGEDDTQRHRLLRRGIPYGQSYRHGSPIDGPNGRDAAFPLDRGLLFQCYGRSIVDQFEFVTRLWVNNPAFTNAVDGVDGVLSSGAMDVPVGHSVTLQRFVTATGGEYFFSPSVTGLRHLAGINA
ncbi:Dyp-type peroxidase [Baekduia sp.]|jgi:Dyp-type peroxidase family|uniref:Dyp-type peroxidase n=1 Tax=Baekduia sp. TaxID=2600305 RepID=UPI002E0490DD|nr:Dyp-type peroxidase [Baekduia sp.]